MGIVTIILLKEMKKIKVYKIDNGLYLKNLIRKFNLSLTNNILLKYKKYKL